jgi:hypothetical protein
MRFLHLYLFTFSILFLATAAPGQNLATPPEGKSLVYFIRSSGTGAVVNFKYFDGEKYLGKFSGKNYFIYECEPGEHVFWVASENRDFIEADLLPDKVYFIEARPTVGAFKSAVKLLPLANDDPESRKRLFKIISQMNPIILDEKDAMAEQQKLEFYIQNGMKKYRADKQKGKVLTQLPATYSYN